MKKFFALLLAGAMTLSLVACGSSTAESTSNGEASTETEATAEKTEATAETAEATTETAAEATGEGVTGTLNLGFIRESFYVLL